MAMFDKPIIHGIQLGKDDDFCLECRRTDGIREYDQDLKDKEVFKIRIHGLDHCLCMKHLKEYLHGYNLVQKLDNDNKNIITIPKDFLDNATTEEVIAYIEKELQ